MKNKKYISLISRLFLLMCIVFFVTGCAEQQKTLLSKKCRGMDNLSQSLRQVKKIYENIKPIRASGTCSVSGKGFKQSFPVRIWHLPPARMSMFGEIMLDPQALCFAVNKNEFWSYSKHLDSYYYGLAGGHQNFRADNIWDIRPESILQIIEPVAIVDEAKSLKKYGPFDVLISKLGSGVTRKIYLEKCGYMVKRIEYIDFLGKVLLSVELGGHDIVEGDTEYKFPRWMVMNWNGSKEKLSMRIDLNSVKLWTPKKAQIDVMFNRPAENRFKYVFKANETGEFVRQ